MSSHTTTPKPPDARESRCNYRHRSGERLRCAEPGVQRAYYPDSKKTLMFCADHFEARGEYAPAPATSMTDAARKINQLLAGTHVLRGRCRTCKSEFADGHARICPECGDTDVEPITQKLDKPRPIVVGKPKTRTTDPNLERARAELAAVANAKLEPPADPKTAQEPTP